MLSGKITPFLKSPLKYRPLRLGGAQSLLRRQIQFQPNGQPESCHLRGTLATGCFPFSELQLSSVEGAFIKTFQNIYGSIVETAASRGRVFAGTVCEGPPHRPRSQMPACGGRAPQVHCSNC